MSDTKIIWGDPIPTPNGRPDWLANDTLVIPHWTTCGPLSTGVRVDCVCGWDDVTHLRLPADHAYYLATSQGFTYWPGGDSAPEDYDGGEIIYRIGSIQPDAAGCSWEHAPAAERLCPEFDIVGYRPKAAPSDGYGRPIIVNGVIPDWLRDTDVGLFENYADRWIGEHGQTLLSWSWSSDWPCPLRIRLPADHPYYTVERYNQERGTDLVYWPGGDSAPADWDGRGRLYRGPSFCDDDWPRHNVLRWNREGNTGDIIGYRRAVAPVEDTVQVPEEHARQRFRRINNPPWHAGTAEDQHINVLKELGLIKPEPTRLERFHASTDNPTIEAALEFER
ncbi:hypothetical protein KNJ79_05245 [Sphingopyxis indica]|uniref:hypothetical protein n=1 Tax=Sphingopyxis indica TaxID=436663 RepID=UPI00293908F0|nr:hypothetical protein [Sphingopyxis indica]WOF44338.1 hypothetical protein KNJ79_05245 [Sphingopyxis indica]